MAVGSNFPSNNYRKKNKKVEERRNGVWQTLEDFPFVNEFIYGYSMVNFNGDLYLFGLFLFNQKLAIFNLLFFLIKNIFKAVWAMARV